MAERIKKRIYTNFNRDETKREGDKKARQANNK